MLREREVRPEGGLTYELLCGDRGWLAEGAVSAAEAEIPAGGMNSPH